MFKEDYQVVPESERKCIWMTSGMISYKLCPGDYSCEECMFDRVMRNETSAMIRRPDIDAALAHDLASIESSNSRIDGSLFYHRNHCWVRVIKPDEVVIGINGVLARLLYQVKTVVLPGCGDMLSRDQFFAHIIQEKFIVPVIMPVNGTVIDVNEEMIRTPDIIRSEHSGKGWLITVRPENLENDLRTLLFGKKADEWYRAMERNVSESLHAVYSISGTVLGQTMNDGGEFMLNPDESLNPDQYYKLMELLSRVV